MKCPLSFFIFLLILYNYHAFHRGDNELAWDINEKDTCLRILEYLKYFFPTNMGILSSKALLTWILYLAGDNMFLRQ